MSELLKEGPKPKWGCLSVAAPVIGFVALLIWLVV